jgi:hypothetical protein
MEQTGHKRIKETHKTRNEPLHNDLVSLPYSPNRLSLLLYSLLLRISTQPAKWKIPKPNQMTSKCYEILWRGSQHYKDCLHQKSSQTKEVDKVGYADFLSRLSWFLRFSARTYSSKSQTLIKRNLIDLKLCASVSRDAGRISSEHQLLKQLQTLRI